MQQDLWNQSNFGLIERINNIYMYMYITVWTSRLMKQILCLNGSPDIFCPECEFTY